MQDTKSKLSATTVALHWIIALTIIGLIAVGLYMKETETLALYPLHKSVGVIIALFILARIVWRIKQGWPEPASDYARHEQLLSKTIHWVLIIGMVLMPISGMMLSGYGGYGIAVFGFELVPNNFIFEPEFKVIPFNKPLSDIGYAAHPIIGYVMIAAISLHLAGALKHHMIDKDGTLRRMLGKAI
jgi:cytochrome b561